jgi:hypothetical protein
MRNAVQRIQHREGEDRADSTIGNTAINLHGRTDSIMLRVSHLAVPSATPLPRRTIFEAPAWLRCRCAEIRLPYYPKIQPECSGTKTSGPVG